MSIRLVETEAEAVGWVPCNVGGSDWLAAVDVKSSCLTRVNSRSLQPSLLIKGLLSILRPHLMRSKASVTTGS